MARGRRSAAEAFEDAREHLNGNDNEESIPEHNSAARADIIRSACREISALESERKSIGDSIREIKQKKIKGDLGMKIGDFNAALRLYQLEGEDRDQFFDALRETFAALGQGAQLDWVDELSRGETANSP